MTFLRPPSRRRPLTGVLTFLLLVGGAPMTMAQVPQERRFRGIRGRMGAAGDSHEHRPYDGRFTFLRVRYGAALGGRMFTEPQWHHDHPFGDRAITRMMSEITTVDPRPGGTILDLDDPELFKYPVAYIAEPGYWLPDEEAAANLRSYLLKGGFLIVDDFPAPHWGRFAQSMSRVLPEARYVELDASAPIFNTFFAIDSLAYEHPYFGGPSSFYGVYEDNDPNKRLMVIINYHNDIGEYWEWSETGYVPIDITNEGFRFGINYLIYGLTH